MKVPPGGFVKRPRNRQYYPVLAYQWVDPESSVFGDPDLGTECLEAYRAVANITDRFRPKVSCSYCCDTHSPRPSEEEDIEVFDPYTDKVWTVSGHVLDQFRVAALNLHCDPDGAAASLYPC